MRGEAALGLGLPLTRAFIEAHGGTVDLDSETGEGHDRYPDRPRAANPAAMILNERASDGRRSARDRRRLAAPAT